MKIGSWELALLVGLIAGCGDRPAAEPAAATPVDPAPKGVKAPPPGAATAKIWFEPDRLPDCTPPVDEVVTINWDASKSTATTVDIRIAEGDGSEGLFATEGTVGSKPSGPWMRPGKMVLVRDHATGEELGRAVAGTKPCQS